MAERLLLELTHCLMRLIDGRSDTRTVAMFSFDGIGKPCIVGSQFEFQRPSAHGKPLLKQLDLSLLTLVQVELAVQYRSEEHTSELQSLMRISYAVFCLNTKIRIKYK